MKSSLQYLTSCLDPQGSDRPRGDKSGEFVLFSREGNVGDLIVEHRVKHNGHQGDTYAPLYRFMRDLPKHITQVVIRNGIGQDHEDGARYVAYTGSDRWLLNNSGERIRIVNSSGVVLATFEIAAHTCNALPSAPKVIVTSGAAAAAFGEVG